MFLVGEKIKRRYHFKHQRPLLTVIFSSSAAACCLTRNMPTSSRGHCCQKQASRSLWGFTWWPLFPSNLHWKVESFALRSLSASIFTAPDFASALLFQRAHLFPAPHCNCHQERTLTMTLKKKDVNNEGPRHSKTTNQSIICRVLRVMLVHVNVI